MIEEKPKIRKKKRTIGYKDFVDFPLLKCRNVACKIDTGAYTSSIHCNQIKIIVDENEQEWLTFHLLDQLHPAYNETEFRTQSFKTKAVKSSNGEQEIRFLIVVVLRLFGRSFEAEFTLADRGDMRFPVLLGRKLLTKRFSVDTARTNLSYKRKQRKKIEKKKAKTLAKKLEKATARVAAAALAKKMNAGDK